MARSRTSNLSAPESHRRSPRFRRAFILGPDFVILQAGSSHARRCKTLVSGGFAAFCSQVSFLHVVDTAIYAWVRRYDRCAPVKQVNCVRIAQRSSASSLCEAARRNQRPLGKIPRLTGTHSSEPRLVAPEDPVTFKNIGGWQPEHGPRGVRAAHPGTGRDSDRPYILSLPGGKGANQAYAAARLGANVAMLGRVGADDLGPPTARKSGRCRLRRERRNHHRRSPRASR